MERPKDLPVADVSGARAAERATSVAAHLDRRFRGAGRQGDPRRGHRQPVPRPHRAGVELRRGVGGAAASRLGGRPATPVIFLDTGRLFAETLAYRDELAERLGLTDVRTIQPDPARLDAARSGQLAVEDRTPSSAAGSARSSRWRARSTAFGLVHRPQALPERPRAALPVFEADGARIKINPLAELDAGRPQGLRRGATTCREHPLVARASVDRLRALHHPRRAGRGSARRPLARPGQDRMRHPSAARARTRRKRNMTPPSATPGAARRSTAGRTRRASAAAGRLRSVADPELA